jgi:hypothetical protein
MSTAMRILPAHGSITEQSANLFRIPKMHETDLLQRVAGDFYAAAAPGEVRDVAERLGMGSTTWWRRTSGTEPTPLSRAGEDVLRFRRAGYRADFYTPYLAIIAHLPDLERLTAAEVNELLLAEHEREDASNAGLNHYQVRHLARGEPCFYEMAVAAMDQGEKSQVIARLALRLHLLVGRREG